MKEMRKFMVCLLGMAAMVMCVMVSSCTNEDHTTEMRSAPKYNPDPIDEKRTVSYSIFGFECTPSESSFAQTMTSEIQFYLNGELEESMKEGIKADCSLKAEKDTVRRSDMASENNGVASLSGNNAKITYSDGQVLDLVFQTKAQYVKYLGKTYRHGWDSVTAVRPLAVKYEDNAPRRARAAESQYVKNTYKTGYPVEVTTSQYYGDGNVYQSHKDTLVVSAITNEMADNSSEYSIDNTGVEILNDTQQKDSVIIIETWADGHKEQYSYPTILNRWLKNIERREVFVDNFDNKAYETGFSVEYGLEKLVREDEMWTIYGREVVVRKLVRVNGHVEEVIYTYYQERADFHFKNLNYKFDYIQWNVENYNDNFVAAASTESGYDMMSYTNEIRTDYAGFIKMSNENIDWFKKVIKIDHYEVINGNRDDYSDAFFTLVELTEIAVYTDGTTKEVKKVNGKFPKNVSPLTNWVINTDVWGVYTSNNLVLSLGSKEAKSKDSFKYNSYTYYFSNEVSGQLNKGVATVVNDIVYDDGNVHYEFSNTELKVNKKEENTERLGEDDEKATYSYTLKVNVEFGAAQEVTLPGTINIIKAQPEPIHDHGKVVATYCTSTPDESRNSWYNVACIQFEDGYRMVGMTANHEAMEFDFSMSSWNGVNSAVYTNGMWVPAFAEDNAGANCMVWTGENGGRRVLDYITATAQGWNNGHNTVWDIRREGRISEDGYSVTFYLNGLAGQTLNF